MNRLVLVATIAFVPVLLLARPVGASPSHVAVGVTAPGGGALIGEGTWKVSDTIGIGFHSALFVVVQSEHIRAMLGPAMSVKLSDRVFISLSAGYILATAKTLHSSDQYHRYGGSFTIRYGLGEAKATTVGFEMNWMAETRVYRDLYENVGGPAFVLTLGRQF